MDQRMVKSTALSACSCGASFTSAPPTLGSPSPPAAEGVTSKMGAISRGDGVRGVRESWGAAQPNRRIERNGAGDIAAHHE
eukprot:scaffold273994_cov28-Tisochrysis_lutea.AAC.1